MKKAQKILSMLLAGSMTIAMFAGCSKSNGEAAEPKDPAQGDQGKPAAEATVDKHEIYKMLPQTSLSGVVDPDMKDRKDINKAWPKTPKDPKKITIGWTEITLGNDWFIGVKEAADKLAKEYGFQLDMLVADGDVQKQSQQIDSFITRGVDIIVVDPTNIAGPVTDIERAVEAGIPVVAVGTVPEESPILTAIIGNPFMLGFEAGKYMATKFDANEEVSSALIAGLMGNSTSESRLCGSVAGFISGRMEAKGKPFAQQEDAWLAGYKMFEEVKKSGKGEYADAGFKVVGWGTGNWTIEGGRKASEDIITANADTLDIIIPDNDFMGIGALQAIEGAGMKGKIKVGTSADGTRAALELIKSGDLICAATMGGNHIGRNVVEFIKQIFIDGKDPTNLPMGSSYLVNADSVITQENVDKFFDNEDPTNKFYKIPPFEFPKSIDEIKAGK